MPPLSSYAPSPSYEKERLSNVATHILEECRMVLPGIQALFGFQLIVVFNERFWEALSGPERLLHLLAITLVALAVALVMTPAAYHRQVLRDAVSQFFVTFASRCLLCSMFPLSIGIVVDFYLIANVILDSRALAVSLSLFLGSIYVGLWFGLPRFLR